MTFGRFNNIACEQPVVVLSVMTIIAFILIVPASYWSMIKDYNLRLGKGKIES
jgi:hypothetical protein